MNLVFVTRTAEINMNASPLFNGQQLTGHDSVALGCAAREIASRQCPCAATTSVSTVVSTPVHRKLQRRWGDFHMEKPIQDGP